MNPTRLSLPHSLMPNDNFLREQCLPTCVRSHKLLSSSTPPCRREYGRRRLNSRPPRCHRRTAHTRNSGKLPARFQMTMLPKWTSPPRSDTGSNCARRVGIAMATKPVQQMWRQWIKPVTLGGHSSSSVAENRPSRWLMKLGRAALLMRRLPNRLLFSEAKTILPHDPNDR